MKITLIKTALIMHLSIVLFSCTSKEEEKERIKEENPPVEINKELLAGKWVVDSLFEIEGEELDPIGQSSGKLEIEITQTNQLYFKKPLWESPKQSSIEFSENKILWPKNAERTDTIIILELSEKKSVWKLIEANHKNEENLLFLSRK